MLPGPLRRLRGTQQVGRTRRIAGAGVAAFALGAALLPGAALAWEGAIQPQPCPGPVCVRPEASPLAHLAGFGVALAGVALTVRQRRRPRLTRSA